MTLGNFFEYTASGGHPSPVPWWAHVIGWPVLVLMFVLTRPSGG
jgi:hypothetical protein